ncbi:MAG TPA: hypothetical protein VHH90_02650 [Polyangia bacterium]|nr:hypothetical protein [Polyangia bacterium]
MGHVRLGHLPRTRGWRAVIDLLNEGGDAGAIADAASAAGHTGLEAAKRDPGVAESLFLLTQLPIAAKHDNFAAALRHVGVPVTDRPGLFELTSAISEALDSRLRGRAKTDLGEMAGLAAVETVTHFVGARLPSLFEADSDDVRAAVGSMSTEKNFGMLTRAFFARFSERYLTYFLSRELSAHVGPGERFQQIDDHSDFNSALRRHCYEAARIVEQFAGEWFSKASWQKDVSLARTRRFAAVAITKLRAEFSRREGTAGG